MIYLFCSLSALSFIAVFTTWWLTERNSMFKPMFLFNEVNMSIYCISASLSGFGLAIITETLMFHIKWYWMFLINIPIVLVLFPFLMNHFEGKVRRKMAQGYGPTYFSFGIKSFILGILFLIVTIIIK